MYSEAQRKIINDLLEKKRLDPCYKPTQEENAVIDAVLYADIPSNQQVTEQQESD